MKVTLCGPFFQTAAIETRTLEVFIFRPKTRLSVRIIQETRGTQWRETEYFSVRGNVIVCVDFNAGTCTLADYIVMDNVNNQYPLPLNYSQDQINSRCSMDRSVQKNGRRLADICIDNSICILNGRSLGDLRGSFTCMSPQGRLFSVFPWHRERDRNDGSATFHTILSDHRPLFLKIHLPIALSSKSKKPSLTTTSRSARHTNSQQHENQTHTRFYWTMTQQTNSRLLQWEH